MTEYCKNKLSTTGWRKVQAVDMPVRVRQRVIIADKLQRHSDFRIQVLEA